MSEAPSSIRAAPPGPAQGDPDEIASLVTDAGDETPGPAPKLMRRLWERRKRSAIRPGALTFHFEAWTRRTLSSEDAAASAELRARLGFGDLLVLHGSAWLDERGVTLLTGPAGIGKSSALRRLEREGHGRLAEDGILLVGLRGESWHLVFTGTGELLARASRISRRFRDLMRVDFSVYENADPEVVRRAHPLRSFLLFRLASLSFTLGAAFGPRDRRPFVPESRPVRTLIVMPHAKYPENALRLGRNGSAVEIPNSAFLRPESAAVVIVSPLGNLREVRERILRAILSDTDRETSGRGRS